MLKPAERSKKVLIPDNLKRYVDLGTDLAQGRDVAFFKANNHALLKYVSSVTVPCCVHDGNPKDILAAIALAKAYNCAVGAHIAYPDPLHHGYQKPDGLTNEDLSAWLRVQLGALKELARVHAVDIQHVRPHGALYSAFLSDEATALVVAETLKEIDPWLILVAPASPVLAKTAEATGLRLAAEIYLGKRYTDEGILDITRLHETMPAQSAFDQAKRLVEESVLTSADGRAVSVKFKSLHISPAMDGALELAEKVNQLLEQPVPITLVDVAASGW